MLKFLTDNGGAYIAGDTRRVALELGLKPVNSPQSNGMAESFVNTFKRDYVSRMNLADAATVMDQLPAAFEHSTPCTARKFEDALTQGIQATSTASRPGWALVTLQ